MPRVFRSALLLGVAALLLAALPPAPPREAPGEVGEEPPDDSWFMLQRMGPDGAIPMERYDAAVEAAMFERALGNSALGASAAGLDWESVGPANIGGRVTALVVTPGATALYLGAANGGVFKSTNAGGNWAPVSDRASFSSVGALALNPLNPATVWCGTGEANSSLDSYDGNGLWRSRNAGATWHHVGLTATRRISSVVVSPADSNLIFVGAMGSQFTTSLDRGFYRSTNGGKTWARTLFVNDSTGVCDIAVNPVHPETVFCATWERVRRLTYRRAYGPGCGIWRSADAGLTWTRLAGGLPAPSDDVGRIALALAPSQPSTVYAQIISGTSLGYVGLGLYRTVDAGETWTRRDFGLTFKNSFGGFGWYFGEVAVSPTNPDAVWTCGVTLLQSVDGGQSFTDAGPNLHPDQHALWIDPTSPQHLLLGNDGGFWWTDDGTGVWTKSLDLPISQFYAGTVAVPNANKILGGLQDNTNIKTDSGPDGWANYWVSADGFYNLVDPTNTNVLFAEYQFCSNKLGIYRSTNNGATMTRATGFSSTDRYNWCTPVVMNPKNHNLLLVGSQRVYRSTNNGIAFSVLSADLTTNPVGALVVYGTLSTLAISPADTSLYLAGTDDGRVWRSQNRGGLWEDITAGLPGRYVTSVVADPVSAQVIYATLSGFGLDEHGPHVFRSTNRGTTWVPIEGNLPDAPVNDLVVDPLDPNTLFLGSDLGVYVSRNLGSSWYALGAGMPLQSVLDLELHQASRQLFAFTHGRSAWKLDVNAIPLAVGGPETGPGVALSAPWPNPARGPVHFTLELPLRAQVDAAVFDPLGRRVRTLARGAREAGRIELIWDGDDERGATVANGVFFVRARAGDVVRSRRFVRAR